MLIEIALAAAVQVAAVAPEAEAPGLQQGRAVTRLWQSGDAAGLEAKLTPAFLQAVGGRDGIVKMIGQIGEQLGKEQAVLREAVFVEGGVTSYYRVSRFERAPDVTARWVIGADGKVMGGAIRPSEQPAATDRLDYRTKAKLRLPFAAPAAGGHWYVAWGGRNSIDNYHVKATDQRFAYDFVVMRGPAVFTGEGKRNEDHFCWGEPVLAPAAGTVVLADGQHLDNERPGALRPNVPPTGNHVVIDHGGGEYSLIGHFKAGSLQVRTGQRVAAGALLGRCGNSGRSSVPHIHYHLQTGRAYGEGVGLPAFFNQYRADGVRVARGEPVRGQRLLPGR
jgi:hypothetical protein